jgi:riboflavin kinase
MADAATETVPPVVQTESFRSERPQIVGPDVPGPPFPIALSGAVQRGFGRGGKDLGCPTGLQYFLLSAIYDNLMQIDYSEFP